MALFKPFGPMRHVQKHPPKNELFFVIGTAIC
jgi:hypothetical protein